MANRKLSLLESISHKATRWIGTPTSIVVHTVLFLLSFLLMPVLGVDRVMLALTTVVSLEAIYLSLFIQMSVNHHNSRLNDLEEDVDDILEDTEELTK